MATVIEEIRKSVIGKSPVIYLQSAEEDRVMRMLHVVAEEQGCELRTWTCIDGLDGEDAATTMDPIAALQAVRQETGNVFFVFKDLAPYFSDPKVVRAVRDIYYGFGGEMKRPTFILTPELVVPESMAKEIHLVEVPPPDEGEIILQIEKVCAENPQLSLDEEMLKQVALALKGLTESEIHHVLNRVAMIDESDEDKVIDEIFSEKKMIVKKSGFLEFSPPRWGIEGVGGLDNLKDWLRKRQKMFTPEAVQAGVPVPKGLLIMGVSGCGKSLCVKVISSLWNIPMFRLDMNQVFSGMYGSPEATFHRALKTIESVAPAVLWLDEIENALGIEEDGLSIASHIFSTFLTWMQEKPPLVFIAATANKIRALPAEIIRKGRFDQVFFCDLPADKERVEIFKIHLARNQVNLDDFDYKMLAIQSDGWNGAEIEQAVIAARTEAFYDGREFSARDLDVAMGKMVPLSDTMEQQIKAIRSWAFSRATPASSYGKQRRH